MARLWYLLGTEKSTSTLGVVLSSDCHQKEMMDYWFPEATQLLKSCGYKERFILTKGGFIPVGL